MTTAQLPVLWLYGPPGVGKSTIGWALFGELARQVPISYVDLDQVGMCYASPTPDSWAPEPRDDYGRHRLQARNLNDLLPGFAAAGAAGVVVSGVVDAARGIDADLLPGATLTSLRLRVESAELARRLRGRGRPEDDIGHELWYAARLDLLPGPVLDTTGRTIAQSLALVRERIGGWPSGPDARSTPAVHPTREPAPGTPGGSVLWLCGATGVGKSTVGWQLYQLTSELGVRCAFVDLEQLGFLRPAPADHPANHGLIARNLAAVWANFQADGARCLLMVGRLESTDVQLEYAARLSGTTMIVCRLDAGATDDAAAGERLGIGDLSIDSDRLEPGELAREILRRTNWMGLAQRV